LLTFREPIRGRNETSIMKAHASVITLGARDMNRVKKFYNEGLGWAVHHEAPGYWLSFSLNNQALEFAFTGVDPIPRTRS